LPTHLCKLDSENPAGMERGQRQQHMAAQDKHSGWHNLNRSLAASEGATGSALEHVHPRARPARSPGLRFAIGHCKKSTQML
jgi:hypothetical protein